MWGISTWIWIWSQSQDPVGDTEHQAFSIDGLAGVRPLIGLLHVMNGQDASAVLAGHGDPGRAEVRHK